MAPPRLNRRRSSAGQEGPTRLPVEILLQIFSILSISDISNIRQACKYFYEITTMRSLWYTLLCKHVLGRGLPIPVWHRIIDSFSRAELENCTRRALRLDAAWTSHSPQSLREVRITAVPGHEAQNVDVRYLPGNQRWLLSISAVSGTNTTWFVIQCWDVDAPTPTCAATVATAQLLSYAINSDSDSAGVVALLIPHLEVFTINYSANRPRSAFATITPTRRPSFRALHVYTGSSILGQSQDGRLVYWEMNTPGVEAELQDTHPIQFEHCLAAVIHNKCAMVIRPSHFHLYSLSPYHSAARSHIPSLQIHPIAQYRWRWPVQSACMSLIRQPPSLMDGTTPRTIRSVFQTIRTLIRFTNSGGWPDNVLHHYVFHPNPGFSQNAPVTPHNVPYLPPSPIECFGSPIDMRGSTHVAINPDGRAVWIDNHVPDNRTWWPGQRVAGHDLRQPATGGNHNAGADGITMARTTFVDQQPLDWRQVTLDDFGGQIALGDNHGKISVFKYA